MLLAVRSAQRIHTVYVWHVARIVMPRHVMVRFARLVALVMIDDAGGIAKMLEALNAECAVTTTGGGSGNGGDGDSGTGGNGGSDDGGDGVAAAAADNTWLATSLVPQVGAERHGCRSSSRSGAPSPALARGISSSVLADRG